MVLYKKNIFQKTKTHFDYNNNNKNKFIKFGQTRSMCQHICFYSKILGFIDHSIDIWASITSA
jgi:hypothetical protein